MKMKKYNIIYADPPWHFQTWGEGGNRNVTSKYNTMTMEEIYNLPIQNISAENAVLFLWVVFPKLHECMKVFDAWGFKYKTCAFTWVKMHKTDNELFTGLGFYTRANAEICLVGAKGKILKRVNKNVNQVIVSHYTEHSKKPNEARKRIIRLFGDLPRVELFARQKAEGWDAWGNEIESDIEL